MAVDHYENFPVASRLLPAPLRPAVVAIYRFARSADDIADEGDASTAQRLAQLVQYRAALEALAANSPNAASSQNSLSQIFVPLDQAIKRHNLPFKPFLDLLAAFEQDLTQTRYPNDESVLAYCRLSANPVGLLMLHLYNTTDALSIEQSDAICSALQRVNFLQDVALDWKKNRIYLPTDALAHFGVSEELIASGACTPAWGALMAEQIKQCRTLLNFGYPLGRRLPGRIGLELRLIVHGGLRILEKIEQVEFDVFTKRPILRPTDWIIMLWRALWR
jgi:squalene synthase HpnC